MGEKRVRIRDEGYEALSLGGPVERDQNEIVIVIGLAGFGGFRKR